MSRFFVITFIDSHKHTGLSNEKEKWTQKCRFTLSVCCSSSFFRMFCLFDVLLLKCNANSSCAKRRRRLRWRRRRSWIGRTMNGKWDGADSVCCICVHICWSPCRGELTTLVVSAIFSGAIVCSFTISSIVNDSPDMFIHFETHEFHIYRASVEPIRHKRKSQATNVSFAKLFNWFSTDCNRCPRPPPTRRHRHCFFSRSAETLSLMNRSLMHTPLVVIVFFMSVFDQSVIICAVLCFSIVESIDFSVHNRIALCNDAPADTHQTLID